MPEEQRIVLGLAGAADILNALVSLVNENANLKSAMREQQALLFPPAGDTQSPDDGEPPKE